jgi:APA family basic amino acid/polyamine antiporter
MSSDPSQPRDPMPPATLNRTLGLWILVFYGLGSIIGAGIYVLIGAVAEVSGFTAPLAFVLAGVLAGLTGLSYAELSARFPEAAGAAAYVQEAFGLDWLSRVIGFSVVAVGVFLSGSLAHGAVGYINEFAAVPPLPAALGLIVLFTVIAGVAVGHSLRLAAAMTVVEIGGLVIVVIAGAPALTGVLDLLPHMVPTSGAAALALVSGAFLAFFAFLGFGDIVNMAEETHRPERTVPRAVLLAIFFSTLIYAVVALVALAAVPIEQLRGSKAPLELVMAGASWAPRNLLSVIALIAIPNGILITIVMLARILYGMAHRGWLPKGLGYVSPLTRTPLRTTLLAGAAIFVFTAGVDFIGLVTLTSGLNLVVFTVVNLALWRLHRTRPRDGLAFAVPSWCPPVAAAFSFGLLVTAIVF